MSDPERQLSWARVAVVPALMLTVAGLQYALSEWGTLHRWKGGGFGMFSAVEQRRILVHVARGPRCFSDEAQFPDELLREFDRCAHHPTERCLTEIAGDLSGGSWLYHFDEPPSADKLPPLRVVSAQRAERFATPRPFPVQHDQVLVEVWSFPLEVGPGGERPSVRARRTLEASAR